MKLVQRMECSDLIVRKLEAPKMTSAIDTNIN